MALPTIILIPGCWHGTGAFAKLQSMLEPKYATTCSKLPSVGADDPSKIGLVDDAEFVRSRLILPLLEQGKDVVLLMHSYSSVPGSMAVKDLDRASRGSGKGAVVGLIYLACFLIPEYSSMFAWIGENRGNATDNFSSVSEDTTFLNTRNAVEYFYHDVPAPEAQELEAALQTHSLRTLAETVPYTAWSKAEWEPICRYIHTKQDRILPLEFQQSFAGSIEVSGEIDSGHSPFASRPEELKAVIDRAMQSLAM